MRAILACSAVLALAPALLPAQVVLETGPMAPRISVSVTRSTRVPADRATMVATVEGTGETAADAAARAEKKAQAILDALKPLGVKVEGPFPYGLVPMQQMSNYPGTPQVPQVVSRLVLRVPLTRLAQGAAVVAAAHGAGASTVPVMQYEYSGADSVRRTLYAEAVAAARRDAEALAQALNLTLGRPVDATINLSNVQPSFAFDNLFARGFDPGPRGTPDVNVSTTVSIRFPVTAR